MAKYGQMKETEFDSIQGKVKYWVSNTKMNCFKIEVNSSSIELFEKKLNIFLSRMF